MFIIVTIIIAFVIALILFGALIAGILSANISHMQRKIDLDRARIAELNSRRAERALAAELIVGKHSNVLVLQDLKIEQEKLKLEALQREINPPRFEVDDYPPA